MPLAICAASPSTTAVLPTPGSPTRHGLFFVLLPSTCIRRWISAFLPMTGSSFPSSACIVRSVPYWSKIPSFLWYASWSSSWYSLISTPRTSSVSCMIFCIFTLSVRSILVATLSGSRRIARSICSVPIASDWKRIASSLLSSRVYSSLGLLFGFSWKVTSPTGEISSSTILYKFASSTPFADNICPATPVHTRINASSRCSVPTYGWSSSLAIFSAFFSTSFAGSV